MKLYLIIATILCTQLAFSQGTDSVATKTWTLEECINYALENNITVKDASLYTNSAEIDLNTAKSARLPNLFGSASQRVSSGNTIDPITSDYVTDQNYSTNVGLNSSVVLFQGNQLNNQVKQSKLLFQQSQFIEEEAKNNIVIGILQAYLQTLYSKEDIAISENNLAASENELQQAKAKLEAGSISLSELTDIQSQTATNKYNVISAKNNYQQNIIVLKQLLALQPSESLEIEIVEGDMELINIELNSASIYNNALNNLPELKSSELDIEINEKALDIAKGAYLPSLTLNGSMTTGYTSVLNSSFRDQFNVNLNPQLAVTLSVPIFNRNRTKNAVQTASINIERAQLQKQTTEKIIYQKVETAYQNPVSSQEQLIAAKASQDAAEQSYDLAQKSFDLGGISTTDLVLSQNIYTNAQQNYIQAKYMNILYHQLLQFYQGNDIKL